MGIKRYAELLAEGKERLTSSEQLVWERYQRFVALVTIGATEEIPVEVAAAILTLTTAVEEGRKS